MTIKSVKIRSANYFKVKYLSVSNCNCDTRLLKIKSIHSSRWKEENLDEPFH